MNSENWIESAGGPLVIISDSALNLWSGIMSRSPYLIGELKDATDFLDPEEADYGKACIINDFIGHIDFGNEGVLVLGDEPMPTIIFQSSSSHAAIARGYYGPVYHERFAEELLLNLDLDSIDNWEFELSINFNSNTQYLFDSAVDGISLRNLKIGEDFLLLHLNSGRYNVFTAAYEPDRETKLFLHKFELLNEE